MSDARRIVFNALPPDIRRRLVESFDGKGDPRPILSDPSNAAMVVGGWSALGVGGVVLSGLIAMWGFGDLYDDVAVQGWYFAPVYAGAVFLAGWGALKAAHRVFLGAALPYTPGRYVLPVDFVNATTDHLLVVPRSSMLAFDGVHQHRNGAYSHTELNLRFAHGLEQFVVHGQQAAERRLEALRASSLALQQAASTNDLGALADLDPLLEPRLSGTWEKLGTPPERTPKEGPVTRPISAVWGKSLLIAALFGVAVGPAIQLVRNLASDEALISEVRDSTSPYDADAYVEHGWRHQDEIDALRTRIEFAQAKEHRKVAELREFVTKHPDSDLVPDARALEHELYGEALAAFQKQSVTEDPTVLPFVTTLLAWLEAHDSPKVLIRFNPPSGEALAAVDLILSDLGGKLDGHPVAPIAPYFDDKHSLVAENAIVDMMEKGFQKVFPNDVLVLQSGDRLTPAALDEPVTAPTMQVTYSVGPSGTLYSLDGSERTYVGITVAFDVEMRIPDSDQTIAFQLDVAPPKTFSIETMSGLAGLGVNIDPTDDSVYQVMALRAFDELGTKVQAVFFEPPPKPAPKGEDDADLDGEPL